MKWLINIPCEDDLVYLTDERLLGHSIVRKFIDKIHLVSQPDGKVGNKNIGFPLSVPGSNEIDGYQLVNYNFNEVVAEPSKTGSSWNLNFDLLPENIENMYIFNDPIDLMSFCELFHKKINFDFSAFSCIQKNITDSELSYLVNFFPRAKIHTCFDFDFYGSVLDIRTVALKNMERVNFQKIGTLVNFEWKQKLLQLPVQELNFAKFRAITRIKTNIKIVKARNALNFNSQLMRLKNNPKTIFHFNHEKI